MKYDYLLVGAGLFGAVVANELKKRGKKIAVVEKRSHIGGNCYTEEIDGIQVHKYGAHIFRTSKKYIWDYIQQFAEFNNFINSPIANYRGRLYNMPFNMNTFYQMWGTITPAEVVAKIEEQRKEIKGEPKNLEEKAISLVGRDVYEILVKEYTEKQWGRKCVDLPASILRRLPVRLIYDNNYFNDRYQGIPIGGYTQIIEKMVDGCEVILNEDYLANREKWNSAAERIIFTGPIDEFYGYKFGPLEYRSLRFEHEKIDCENYQGVAVMNFTDIDTPYTRIIEHKHFEFGTQPTTIISKEYSFEWRPGIEPYYPVNDEKNQTKYNQYRDLAAKEINVMFGGRLGSYKYTDMQDTIGDALAFVAKLCR